MNVWQRQQSLKVQKGKEGTLQDVVAAVAVAVYHLQMISLQKGKKTANPMVNADTEKESQLLMTQGKQPALIVNKDTSSKNSTSSSTGDILKSIDDDSNEEEYGPKISDPLAQRIEGKWKTVNIRES